MVIGAISSATTLSDLIAASPHIPFRRTPCTPALEANCSSSTPSAQFTFGRPCRDFYVGRTKTTLKSRWKWHRDYAMNRDSQIPVHKSIRKIGLDNVAVVPIVQSFDMDYLDQVQSRMIARCRRLGYPI